MTLKLQRTNAKTNKIKRANDFILIAGICGITGMKVLVGGPPKCSFA